MNDFLLFRSVLLNGNGVDDKHYLSFLTIIKNQKKQLARAKLKTMQDKHLKLLIVINIIQHLNVVTDRRICQGNKDNPINRPTTRLDAKKTGKTIANENQEMQDQVGYYILEDKLLLCPSGQPIINQALIFSLLTIPPLEFQNFLMQDDFDYLPVGFDIFFQILSENQCKYSVNLLRIVVHKIMTIRL